jgi:hypothetical protein
MTSPIDPNQIVLTGENSFIRLSSTAGGASTTRTSHWRILWSPAGAGHVLFLKSEQVAGGAARVYSDNIALTRYLQEEIETHLFPEFADVSLPVIAAEFGRSGDAANFYTESVATADGTLELTWYDFLTPFMLNVPAGSVEGRPHGVYSCFIPARHAQLTVGGQVLPGVVTLESRGHAQSSTACIAWSETWVKP